MYPAIEGSTRCHPDSFDTSQKVECRHGFVYDSSIFEQTAVTALDLVCDEGYKARFQGTVLMVGLLLGCVFGGPMADKVGRKVTLTVAVGVLGPVTIVGGFIPNFVAFSALRLIALTATSMIWISSHTLIMEHFDKRWRKTAYVLSSLLIGLFNTVTSLIAYLERDWRYMHLWAGLPSIIVCPLLVLFLRESARWNIVNGRLKVAERLLMKIAKINRGTALPEEDSQELKNLLRGMTKKTQQGIETDRKLTPLDMFRRKYVVVTLILMSVWVTSIASFYALALNSTSLAGDIFLNQVYSNLSELPVTLVVYLCIDMIGRRFTIVSSLLLGGSSILAMAFVSKTYSSTILALYIVGKAGSSCCIAVAWFYTAEVYPTNMRAQAVATCSLVARIGGALATFVADLSQYSEMVPFLVIGIPVLISGAAAIALPETRRKNLPESVSEGKGDEPGNEITETFVRK